jgi:hypothetical protein
MKKTSNMYKFAILLAIGAGLISVLQTDQLRNQLKKEREYLHQYESHNSIIQKESLNKAFENGYKRCLVDIYNGNPRYLVTETEKDGLITLWKKDSKVNKHDNPPQEVSKLNPESVQN